MKEENPLNALTFKYETDYSVEERKSQFLKMKEKHSDRIPIIVEKKEGSLLPDLLQSKFLIPDIYSFGEFTEVIKNRLHLRKSDVMFFIFDEQKVYKHNSSMIDIYEEEKNEDGFLYCKYTTENTLGYCDLNTE